MPYYNKIKTVQASTNIAVPFFLPFSSSTTLLCLLQKTDDAQLSPHQVSSGSRNFCKWNLGFEDHFCPVSFSMSDCQEYQSYQAEKSGTAPNPVQFGQNSHKEQDTIRRLLSCLFQLMYILIVLHCKCRRALLTGATLITFWLANPPE